MADHTLQQNITPKPFVQPETTNGVTLPAELLREIIELTVVQAPGFAPTLCMVSSVVNACIRRVYPFLYRVLRVDDAKIRPNIMQDEPRFVNTSQQSSYPQQNFRSRMKGLDLAKLTKFAPFVHFLLIQNRPAPFTVKILQRCTNVQDLSLWIITGNNYPIRRLLSNGTFPHLRRLSMDPVLILGRSLSPPFFDLSGPIFRQLSHLELITTSSDGLDLWDAARDFSPSRMPNLTHVAMHIVIKQGILSDIVENCPQIRVIAVLGAHKMISGAKETHKVVFINKGHDLLEEWEQAALHGGGFWDRAESALEGNYFRKPRY